MCPRPFFFSKFSFDTMQSQNVLNLLLLYQKHTFALDKNFCQEIMSRKKTILNLISNSFPPFSYNTSKYSSLARKYFCTTTVFRLSQKHLLFVFSSNLRAATTHFSSSSRGQYNFGNLKVNFSIVVYRFDESEQVWTSLDKSQIVSMSLDES